MSDYRNPYLVQGAQRESLYGNPYQPQTGSQGPSLAERQLRPYIEEEKAKKKAQWSAIGLLPIVFDVLQTGNYLSAGVANEVVKSIKERRPFSEGVKAAIKGAWNGLTWKDKKTYSDVIRGNLDEEDLKKFDEKLSVAGFKMPFSPVDIAGFVGDVLLDPTTYMGFGATAAAKATAREAAEDAVKIAVRGFDDKALASLADKGITKEVLQRAFDRGGSAQVQELLGKSGTSFDRYINDVYQRAFTEAITVPAQKVKNKYLGEIAEIEKKNAAKNIQEDVLPALKSKLLDDAASYAKLGEREFNFLGFKPEALRSIREPWAPERAWSTLKKKIGETTAGHKFSDAWWTVMNTGPMAAIKNALNIRNPYQKMIRLKELDSLADAQANFSDLGRSILEAFDGISDKDTKLVDKIYQIAETYNKQFGYATPIGDTAKILMDKIEQETGKKIAESPENVIKAITNIEAFNKRNITVLRRLEAEGLINSAPSELEYYIRSYYKQPTTRYGVGTGTMPSIAQHRQFTRSEVLKQDVDRVKTLFGVDDDTARTIVQDMGGSAFSSDIKESMLTRALIQSKIEAKANLLRQMKEFGIRLEDLNLGSAASNQLLANAKEKGLDRMVSAIPAFDGMLFDKSIKSAVERVVNATTDESMNLLRTLMTGYNSWWKGTALLGPHTKIRNFIENNWTGFMKHGLKWFDVKSYDVPAVIATLYASRATNPKTMLKQFGLDEGFMKTQLNKVWFTGKEGSYTLKDLADIARHKGVFSERTMGYDIAESAAKIAGKEDKSLLRKIAFVGHETSHKIDEIVENSARIKSFLMDFQDVTKGLPAGSEAKNAIEWASMEAKKWWIDYCFDEKTEILTDEGWKNINTIRGDEMALTYNAEKEILEYTNIDHVHKSDYEGPMYAIKNKRFDAFVTPHHKWVKVGGLRGGVAIKPKWSIVDTDYIVSKDAKIIVSACAEKHKIKIYSDQFVTLCGWILAEGAYPKNVTNRKDRMKRGKGMAIINHILLYQSLKHNPQYVEEIRELMRYFKTEGDVFSEGKGIKTNGIKQWYVGGELSKKIRSLFPKKVLTHSFVSELTTEQCKLLMDTLNKGDGSKNKQGHWEFVQKSKDFVDAYQHLCFMCGHRTVVRKRSCDSCYSVSVLCENEKMYVRNVDTKKCKYSGKIWCITTKNHTLVARRNGTIYITGNSDLSEFERKILRNVIPFYSFMRHNVANKLQALVMYPETMSIFPKFQNLLQEDDPNYDPELIPAYMKNLGMFPVGKLGEKSFAMLNTGLSMADFNKIPLMFDKGSIVPFYSADELKDDIISSAHPILKTVVEMIPEKGYDTFRKRDLASTAKAPYLMRYLSTSPTSLNFLDGLMRVLGFEDGIRATVGDDGKLEIDAKIARIMESNLPIIRHLDMVLMSSVAGLDKLIPGIRQTIEEGLNVKSDYEGLEEIFQIIAYWTGVKLKEADLDKMKKQYGRDIYYSAQEKRIQDMKLTAASKRRKLKYDRREDAKMRRLGLL